MNHETDPPDTEQPAEKPPAPEMPPESEIDRMQSDYEAEQVRAAEERRQQLLESTDRMFQISDELAAQRDAQRPKPDDIQFNVHPTAQRQLDRRAEEYDRQWEIEESKYTPRTAIPAQLRETMEKSGMMRDAPSSEEIEAAGLKEDEEKRAEAAARQPNHSRQVHFRRGQRSRLLWRPKGSIQRDIADSDSRVRTDRELRGDL